MPVPVFSPTDRPVDVLDGAGKWLAQNLSGFRWVKSRRTLERRTGPQLHRLHLQTSSWSRAGIATWVGPRLTVLDDRLVAWRVQHQDEALGDGSMPPSVFNSLFVNFLEPSTFELSGLPQHPDGPKYATLQQLLDCLSTQVMPVLDAFETPSSLAANLPPRWWSMVDAGTVEVALACDDPTAAAALIRGHMERPLRGTQSAESRLSAFRDGWDRRGRGERPDDPFFAPLAMGWLSRAHGLIEPDTLRATTLAKTVGERKGLRSLLTRGGQPSRRA